jgi:hypothetical protein
LVTEQDNLSHLIQKEMSLLLGALMAERDPENLLREELALKLRSLNIRSSVPSMLEIKRICEELAHYCHKDGRKDAPRLSLIRVSGKSLKVRVRRIAVVSKITEPLYTSSDMSTAAKVLDGWWKVAQQRPFESAHEDFLRTIMSDVKKSPDGLLTRLQPEDIAVLKNWFPEKIKQGPSEDRYHTMTSVGAEFDWITEVLRLSVTKRTLFVANESDTDHDLLLLRWPTFLPGISLEEDEMRNFPDQNASFVRQGGTGLGPMLMQQGDEIFILPGSTMPLVLRPRTDYPPPHYHPTTRYQLVGDCFLHGVMDGELGAEVGCILDYIVHLDSHYAKRPDLLDENVDATAIDDAVISKIYSDTERRLGVVSAIEIH